MESGVRSFLLLLVFVAGMVSSAKADLYTVKRGDSLYKIARKFHTTVSKIKRLNGLRSNLLRPGQRLIVPGRRYRPVKSREVIAFLEKSTSSNALDQTGSEIYQITDVVYEEGEKLADALSTPPNVPYDNWSLSILENSEYRDAFLRYMVSIFKKLKNTPYVFGGGNPKRGLDCSSFTMYVYKKLGVKLPRTARAQFNKGVPVDLKDLKVGDLVFFRTYARYPSHVGIYIGNGRFVHFSSMFHGLAISSMKHPYFKRRFIGARRVLSEKVVQRVVSLLEDKNEK